MSDAFLFGLGLVVGLPLGAGVMLGLAMLTMPSSANWQEERR